MTSPESDFDALVDALRSDLPSTRDERRVRRRLLAAGIGVATGMAAPTATASGLVGGASSAAALLQKLGALSWGAKLGLAGVAASAVLPATVYLTSAKPSSPPVDVAEPNTRVAARSANPSPAATAVPFADPGVPSDVTGFDSIAKSEPALVAPEPAPLPPDSLGSEAPRPPAPSSSAAFPTDEGEGARDRSTLGEETVLVESALYALRQGDRAGARRTLEEHARRFPTGLLARERDRALERATAEDDSKPTTGPR